MPSIDLVVESKIHRSSRVRQLEAMFDVPANDVARMEWKGEFPFDAEAWNVGLIVGPSGCGKSTVSRKVFGEPPEFAWNREHSVIDDFPAAAPMGSVAEACQSVGFNTIPAWMRPYDVLSTGEKFRVDLARRIVEQPDPIVVDEFTSTVDRQVGQIGAHAIQKWARKHGRKFVAVTCHYDVAEWLQPDWMLEPVTMTFTRRLVRRRPRLEAEVRRVPYDFWRLFAPYHYLTSDLNRSARCFGLFVEGRIAAFAGVLYRPHPKVRDVMGVSRLVTLPDWQGLGLAMILAERVGAAYKAIGKRLRTYPAHPSLIRSFDKSKTWAMAKRPGGFHPTKTGLASQFRWGERPCAVFEFVGPAMDDRTKAAAFIGGSA